jgi:hypothetical protein
MPEKLKETEPQHFIKNYIPVIFFCENLGHSREVFNGIEKYEICSRAASLCS